MEASDRIKVFIKAAEELRLEVYQDGNGNATIGFGHKLPAGSTIKTITLQQAEVFFAQDILVPVAILNQYPKMSLDQNEFDSLVSFIFNCGQYAFYHSSVYLFLSQGLKFEAASYIPRWCHEGKTATEGLLLRRAKELCIFMGIPVVNY